MGSFLSTLMEVHAIRDLAASEGLVLDPARHRGDLALLREIFIERVYADWFPFHARATVIDVGAHKGFFALFAARKLAAGSRIIALEPAQANFRQLSQNLNANEAASVDARHLGLWSKTGTLLLHHGRPENATAFAEHHAHLRRPASGSTEEVNVMTLADFLADQHLDQVDFLKLDVEGAEYPILLESSAATLRRIKTISLEFHDLKRPGYTGLDLVHHLRAAGFKVPRFRHHPTRIDNDHGSLIATRDG